MGKHAITVGSDPEVFLRSKKNSKLFLPAIGIIGGTKAEPIPIPGLDEGFTMQEDNVMCEFNVPPCRNAQEFSRAITLAMDGISRIIPADTEIVVQPSAVFKPRHLKSLEAQTFGCEPDFNAWTGIQNQFIGSTDPNLRCCGGHIHVGLPNDKRSFENDCRVIKFMDLYLGLPSIIVDTDTRRKEMYGKAGAFRPKPYGVEYRTLSNFWTATPGLRQWAFEATENAVDAAYDSSKAERIEKLSGDIINAINTQDTNSAEHICAHFGVEIP